MEVKKAFTAELQHEAASTRKMLARVPFDKQDWQPHERSSSMIALARHIGRIPTWITYTLGHDAIDFSQNPFGAFPEIKSADDLIAYYDKNVSDAQNAIDNASDDDFMKPFEAKSGEKVLFSMPKAAVIRNMSLNHLVHHRGQLSVYLRLLDIPVPGMYGQSADDKIPA